MRNRQIRSAASSNAYGKRGEREQIGLLQAELPRSPHAARQTHRTNAISLQPLRLSIFRGAPRILLVLQNPDLNMVVYRFSWIDVPQSATRPLDAPSLHQAVSRL